MHLQSMIASRPQLKGQTSDALHALHRAAASTVRRPAWPARAPVSTRSELEGLRECIRLDLDCADICAGGRRDRRSTR